VATREVVSALSVRMEAVPVVRFHTAPVPETSRS
jgi:hypothetical protein